MNSRIALRFSYFAAKTVRRRIFKQVLSAAAAVFGLTTMTAQGAITFNKDIAPILWQHCVSCHRPSQAAPFSLLTYAEARKRAKELVEVTASRYMPPWLPAPGHGEFAAARLLSTNQITALREWALADAPEGAASDLPPIPEWTEGWQLGPPDLVITMPESYQLAAEGKDVYRTFVIPIPLASRRYVQAVELQPGNRRIVHHAFMLLDRTPQSRRLDQKDAEPGFAGLHSPPTVQTPAGQFLSWQPGKQPDKGFDGLAWALEPATDLVLQAHLQPTGKPERLQASVGFYFTDRAPTNTPFKIGLRAYDIDIPAGATDYVIKDRYVLPVDVEALAVLPHAHYLATQMAGFALLPDGTKRWLFLIKHWDFNWQGDYRYAQPLPLPKGSTIVMEYTYDNSTNNARNPSQPPRRVKYGLASTDEMGELWLQVLTRHTNDLAVLANDYAARVFRDAIAYNQYLLQLNTNDAAAHLELGKALTAQGKPAEALKHLRTATRLQPENEEAHYFLGLLYQRQNKSTYARTEFEQTLRLNPQNFKAHTYLGLAFLDLGDLDRAEEQLRKALRLQPGDEVAQSNLDLVLRTRAQREKKN